jgi:hypothetical protein
MAATVGASIIVVAIRYFWDLRKYVWFWVAVLFIVCLHVAIVVVMPWPDRDYRGIQLLPIGLLDFGIVCGIIRLVEKGFRKSS